VNTGQLRGPSVSCTNCQTVNPAARRFCARCAELLPLPVGAFFAGRYTVRRSVGVGGIGRGYRVTDERGAPGPLLLTELRQNRGWAPEARDYYRAQFAREVELLLALQELPTVPILHQGLTKRGDDRLFFVVVAPGETLQTALEKRKHPFPPDVVVDWGTRLGELLEHLHGQEPPLIHGDLHPGKLVLDGPTVRLTDLNIIRRIRTDGLPAIPEDNGFVAPEHLAGQAEPCSDLYSLAATLAVLLTNQPPPPPSPAIDAINRRNARVPEWLSHLIAINLSVAPYDRYASAADFVADLRRQQVTDTITCHACGAQNRRAEIYCQECTRPLLQSTRTCEECGQEMPINARFCPSCGVRVG
jgi:serine/threonine protein kinase